LTKRRGVYESEMESDLSFVPRVGIVKMLRDGK
jgi:hypothetical protein